MGDITDIKRGLAARAQSVAEMLEHLRDAMKST